MFKTWNLNKLFALFSVMIFAFASCDGRERKHKSNAEILKENNLLESFSEAITFVPKSYTEIKTDTLFNNGFSVKIKYRSLENSFAYIETKKLKNDSVSKTYYKNFEAQLLVLKDHSIVNQSLINKSFLQEFTGASISNEAVMQYVWIDAENSTAKNLFINTSFCIPNTDDCRDFTLNINDKGVLKIEEITRSPNII